MVKKSSFLRKFFVVLMSLAIVVAYSVVPFTQSYAATKKPTKITLTTTSKTVDIKGKVTVSVKSVKPAKASKSVTWKSSNKKIATVSSKGVVTGKKKGKVKITATSKANKKVKKTITITVKDLKAKSIKLSKKSATVKKGKSLTLKATVSPKGVYAPVTWKSSNTKVAKVSSKGKVTAVAPGTATITVSTSKKTAGKAVKATCKITVPKPADPTPVEPEPVETPQTVGAAKTRTMTTSVNMTKYPEGQVVKVWLPIPQDDEFQTITNVDFSAPKATKAEITTEKVNGNKMLYVEWGKDVAAADRKAELIFTAKRYEVSRDPASIVEDPAAGIPADVKAYIGKESEYVKVNAPIVKDTAAKIVEGKTGTPEKARAIYEWVIANLERIDDTEVLTLADGTTHEYAVDGCGYGDTVAILTDLETYGRAGGHCTDINSTFVALCRAAGIPAREMFGIRMNPDATGGQHCWAEFYVAGTGWVYADPGDVLKAVKGSNKNMTIDQVKAAKEAADIEQFWAKVDNNRVVLSRGRDIVFEPAQAWGTCNTFGYPAAEVDGKRLETSFADAKNFVYTISSKEDRTIFVDKDYVKNAMSKKSEKTVLAEVSWGPDAPAELIPGAIHVNTDDLESNGQDYGYEHWDLRGFNDNFKQLGDALAKYGITKDSELICYGWGENNSGVTRLAMAALMMGVKDVKVLEGGTEVWFNAGYDKVTEAAEPKAAESFGDPEHPEWVISTADMLDKVENDSNFKLVSIRSYDEFIGQNSGYAYIDKAGEPKGAIWGRDTDDGSYFQNGEFVGVDKINEYLARYDASTENELAFYCGTGWRATIPFLICYEAGIDNMKLWDDGWFVYSGAYADSWNWTGDDTPDKMPAVHDEYPVQIGDPAEGTPVYTTVGELEPKFNPMRGVSVKNEAVGANSLLTLNNNFSIMPPKPGITNSLKFTSSDESVATVDAEGNVTVKTLDEGKSTVITATSYATKGSAPGQAGQPTQDVSYTLKIAGSFETMDAELWPSFGIDYEEIDLSKDFILDVRAPEVYAEGHIVGSTNVSVAAGAIAEDGEVAKALDKAYADAAGARIVIVCNSGQSLAKRAMEYFRTHDADMSTVTYLKGGNKGIVEGEYKLNNGVKIDGIELAKDVVVDVRPADMYAAGHIVGSTNINVQDGISDEEKTQLDELLKTVPEGGKLVVVCIKGHGLAKRTMAYYQSANADMKKITYLIGGATGAAESEYALNLGITADQIDISGDVVVDLRPADMYNEGHIVASENIDVMTQFTDAEKAALDKQYAKVAGDGRLVLVCIKGHGLAKKAMGYLQSTGVDMSKVTYLIGGATGLAASEYASLLGVKEVAEDDFVIDIRPESQFVNGIPAGTVSSPVSNPITDAEKAALIKVYEENKDKNIVLLCVSGKMLAWNALGALQDAGADLTKVTYLIGGFNNNWKNNYPYTIGDVAVDPVQKTVTISATVDSTFTAEEKAIAPHFVLSDQGGLVAGHNAPFVTPATTMDFHAALTAIGGIPWSDSKRTLKDGQRLSDVKGDNDNFSHLEILLNGEPVSNVLKYKKAGVEADPADAIDMAFSGNKINQSEFKTGCISCLNSCYAGIVTNDAVGFNTANEADNYYYINSELLSAGQEVVLTYVLK